jgi:hypothetical protein
MIFIFLGTAALFARAGERRGEDEELDAASQTGLTSGPFVWHCSAESESTSGVSDVTHILAAIGQGDAKAADKLLPLVYEELRKLACARAGN